MKKKYLSFSVLAMVTDTSFDYGQEVNLHPPPLSNIPLLAPSLPSLSGEERLLGIPAYARENPARVADS